jgi:hypothetical protein
MHALTSLPEMIQVKDFEICEWIMAEFSTTTDIDRTIYAIEMMATMKKYVS